MANAKKNIRSLMQLNKAHNSMSSQKESIVVDENVFDDRSTFMTDLDNDDGLGKTGERTAEQNSLAEMPRLDFFYVENILAWTYCRLVFQNFGDRYRFRMDVYVGKAVIFFLPFLCCFSLF